MITLHIITRAHTKGKSDFALLPSQYNPLDSTSKQGNIQPIDLLDSFLNNTHFSPSNNMSDSCKEMRNKCRLYYYCCPANGSSHGSLSRRDSSHGSSGRGSSQGINSLSPSPPIIYNFDFPYI